MSSGTGKATSQNVGMTVRKDFTGTGYSFEFRSSKRYNLTCVKPASLSAEADALDQQAAAVLVKSGMRGE